MTTTSDSNKAVSRRQFLHRLGITGGAGITLGAMAALGIAPEPVKIAFRAPQRGDFTLTGRASASVLILGAGIAGLTAAYELEKAGYHCQIIEARDRPGGRNWTARRGTRETSTDGSTQLCQFDAGLSMNVGPTRIPQHHTTLDYCRELHVPVHVFNNQNADAYYYFENAGSLSNKPLRHRSLQTDSRGYIAELLAKAVNQGALDQDLSANDKDALIEFLRATGALTPQNRYTQGQDLYSEYSDRGYQVQAFPGAGLQVGTNDPPVALSDLLALHSRSNGGFFNLGYWLAFEDHWDQAMPMFEPDNGMDSIPHALTAALKQPILYNMQVTRIENTSSGVSITGKGQGDKVQQFTADYCICTIAPHLLTRITNNFAAQVNADLAVPVPDSASKIGLQFRRRFWEEEDRIFGGITMTNMDIIQIIYPSSGYFERKGIVIGYYNFADFADAYGRLTPKEREQRAIDQGSKIHGPAYRSEFESSFSHDWRTARFNEGSWMAWPQGTQGGPDSAYGRLLQPVDRIYFCGDYLTHTIAWQHGAFESARKVVMDLHQRVLATAP